MLPEHTAALQFDDMWEDGWYGVNTRWWTDLHNYDDVKSVCVLLFGVGTGQEGVYSLQRWTDDGLPHDTVLAFASPRDAERYAAMLEEEMGRMAVVEPISPPDLKGFCFEAGFDIRVVDSSAVMLGLFSPPNQTVDVTDWERASRLREGAFSVLSPEEAEACMLVDADVDTMVDMSSTSVSQIPRSGTYMDQVRNCLETLYKKE